MMFNPANPVQMRLLSLHDCGVVRAPWPDPDFLALCIQGMAERRLPGGFMAEYRITPRGAELASKITARI